MPEFLIRGDRRRSAPATADQCCVCCPRVRRSRPRNTPLERQRSRALSSVSAAQILPLLPLLRCDCSSKSIKHHRTRYDLIRPCSLADPKTDTYLQTSPFDPDWSFEPNCTYPPHKVRYGSSRQLPLQPSYSRPLAPPVSSVGVQLFLGYAWLRHLCDQVIAVESHRLLSPDFPPLRRIETRNRLDL